MSCPVQSYLPGERWQGLGATACALEMGAPINPARNIGMNVGVSAQARPLLQG